MTIKGPVKIFWNQKRNLLSIYLSIHKLIHLSIHPSNPPSIYQKLLPLLIQQLGQRLMKMHVWKTKNKKTKKKTSVFFKMFVSTEWEQCWTSVLNSITEKSPETYSEISDRIFQKSTPLRLSSPFKENKEATELINQLCMLMRKKNLTLIVPGQENLFLYTPLIHYCAFIKLGPPYVFTLSQSHPSVSPHLQKGSWKQTFLNKHDSFFSRTGPKFFHNKCICANSYNDFSC